MSNKGSDNNVGSIEKISQTSDKNVANIEEDVKILENFCEFEDAVVLTDYALTLVQETIKHILAELEQKDKRIQELEEKVETKQKFIIMASEVIKNSIPKQAVIDKIDELKLSGGSNGKDNVENLVRELAIDILQELLEGERK